MKKLTTPFLAFLIIALLVVASPNGAMADYPKNWSVYQDGEQIYFEEGPITLEGETMVPLKPLAQRFHLTLSTSHTQSGKTSVMIIEAKNNNTQLVYTEGSKKWKINGKENTLTVAPVLMNGRIFVPIRSFASALGEPVTLDAENMIMQMGKPLSLEDILAHSVQIVIDSVTSSSITYKAIDNKGATKFTIPYPYIFSCGEGITAALGWKYNKLNSVGIYDQSGKFVSAPDHYSIYSVSEGLALFRDRDGKGYFHYGYFDMTGKVVIPAIYRSARDFSSGLALVVQNGKAPVFINHTGKAILKPAAGQTFVESFSEGLAAVAVKKGTNTTYGYINTKGSLVIPAIYEEANSFSSGRAAVKVKGKWGYIDQSGKLVIPAKYTSASLFRDGVTLVYDNQSKTVIDVNGEAISIPGVNTIYCYSGEGLFAFPQNGRLGYVDRQGHIVLPARYDWVGDFHHGMATVIIDGEDAYINRAGEVIWKRNPSKS